MIRNKKQQYYYTWAKNLIGKDIIQKTFMFVYFNQDTKKFETKRLSKKEIIEHIDKFKLKNTQYMIIDGSIIKLDNI